MPLLYGVSIPVRKRLNIFVLPAPITCFKQISFPLFFDRSPSGPSGDDRQSVAMKDLLDAIYPRADRPDYVVRLEPIQTTNKAMFQYITTEEELARYPSHTPRYAGMLRFYSHFQTHLGAVCFSQRKHRMLGMRLLPG